jgi:hypothetical protein
MTTTLRALIAAGVVVASFSLAVAKLPPPPPLDEAGKAAAEAKKEKDAAAAAKDNADLAKAQDRVAAKYIADQRAKGKTVTPQVGATPAPDNGKKK